MYIGSVQRVLLSCVVVSIFVHQSDSVIAKTLKESVAITLDSNPELGQAVQNREAIEFELRQARGLYLPKIDLEAGLGVRRLDNPSRRRQGIQDVDLYPTDVGVTISHKLFDGYKRRSEVERQASRVDGASFRVLERSEFLALNVTREYFEIALQYRIIAAAKRNVSVHETINGLISKAQGNLTAADNQQGQERLISSKIRLREAQQELVNAKIAFNRLVGMPVGRVTVPSRVGSRLPKSLASAISIAKDNNPRMKIALADISAAEAEVKAATSNYFPELSIEGNARAGDDLDGTEGRESDLRARLVLRWNIFKGGIDVAQEQEKIRRVSETRHRNHQVYREVEEAVRISWERRRRQSQISRLYREQLTSNKQLVNSYREQFKVGKRSLLDLLDSQNTSFNTEVLALTASYSNRFAEYRLLAATGQLLESLNVTPPHQADAYARDVAGVPEISNIELDKLLPSHQGGRIGYQNW